MWNVQTKVIPVIIGATEPYQNHSEYTCATYRDSAEIKELQKTAILDTAHILWEVLM
jgi:hypothetical protein